MEKVMNEKQKEFLLLQINDALFPIGGYSHSYGLETYIQKELVGSPESAKSYIEHTLLYNTSYTDLLAVRLAYEYTLQKNITEIEKLEEILTAVKTPMEIRLASFKLGARFMKTVGTFQINYENSIFKEYYQSNRNRKAHHTIAYGVFCGCVGISFTQMLKAYLYAQVSAIVTNCVKTIPLSQTVGQQMLFELHPLMEEVIELVKTLKPHDLGRTVPGFDIRAMQHEVLYSRLYMS